MDKDLYKDMIANMAAIVPDQSWNEILEQLVDSIVECTGKLNSIEVGRLLAIAAAIKRMGEGGKGWWQ